ncbi:MAG: hypothetical protein NVSMB32_01190 [Actinomycetota bacterium]
MLGGLAAVIVGALLASLMLVSGSGASVASQVDLGTAEPFAVLGGQTVTNAGTTTISGNLGVSPGTAITDAGTLTLSGTSTVHRNDAVASQAQSDVTIAYNDAAGRAPDSTSTTPNDITGATLLAGVYRSSSSLALTGPVTLDAQGDPNAVFIFRVGSTLITGSGSRVVLTNNARGCNVFWQVGSSATLGTTTDFQGTILALTSITANTGATVHGRLLARNGSVTLDTNTITRQACPARQAPRERPAGAEQAPRARAAGPGRVAPRARGARVAAPGRPAQAPTAAQERAESESPLWGWRAE